MKLFEAMLVLIRYCFFSCFCVAQSLDLVGFTSWSSGRQPSDVFLLLETIYGRFDAMAKQCCVFKVETIGDCYVAASGLPRSQEKHALIMTNFARKCKRAIRQELSVLAEKLGIDTLDLAIRIGLHSGPVIAGVLRGDKARFQLFGDTMNTASRMESNGLANRIHVSEATASLLRVAGKESWLKAREVAIVAKGKGEMQTYWVEDKDSGSVAGGTSLKSASCEHSESHADLEEAGDNGSTELRDISQKLQRRLKSSSLPAGASMDSPILVKVAQDTLSKGGKRSQQDD